MLSNFFFLIIAATAGTTLLYFILFLLIFLIKKESKIKGLDLEDFCSLISFGITISSFIDIVYNRLTLFNDMPLTITGFMIMGMGVTLHFTVKKTFKVFKTNLFTISNF